MARIGFDARKLADGGIGRYVREILARVPALLPDAEFVAAVPRGATARLAAIAPAVRAVEVGAPGYSLREHVEIARALGRERCALVHFPHYVVPLLLRPAALVVTVHDAIHVRHPRTPFHSLYARAMLGVVRRRAAMVLVPSDSVRRDLAAIAGIAGPRVAVVPNGVADAFLAGPIPSPAEIAAFERAHGLVPPWVLQVTNGLPHKGLDVLLGALRGLPGVGLALAGSGARGAAVSATLARRGPGGGRPPALLGEIPDRDLRVAYRAATAVVVPSLDEGFGLPALEAMAAGGVVVATRAGGLAEACGDAAISGPPGSVEWLQGALYRVAFGLERTERAALIDRGRQRAAEFPWDRAARATGEAYRRLLAGRP